MDLIQIYLQLTLTQDLESFKQSLYLYKFRIKVFPIYFDNYFTTLSLNIWTGKNLLQ